MNVSKPIGYILIVVGIIGIIFGVGALSSGNGFVELFGIIFIIAALILAGIGAIAIKH